MRKVFCPTPGAAEDRPQLTLKGKWNTQLVCPELGNKVIYTAPTVTPDRVSEQYGFSPFACQLNALPAEGAEGRKAVAPTDSRLRPDQRMHERADEGADAKKLELEEMQRERRGKMEAAGTQWVPR